MKFPVNYKVFLKPTHVQERLEENKIKPRGRKSRHHADAHSVPTCYDPLETPSCYNDDVVVSKSLRAPLPRSAGVTPGTLTPR